MSSDCYRRRARCGGLVVKPVVGVADGIASASEGIGTSASASSQGIFAQRQVRPFAPVARRCHAPPQTQCTRRQRGAAAASRDRPVRRAAAATTQPPRRSYYSARRSRCRFSRTAARRRPVLLSLCMHRWPRERAGRLPASCADHNARGLPLGSVGNSAELEWAEPLSAIATAEVAAEPRTACARSLHLRDGGMRFVEGDARLRQKFVTKLASAIARSPRSRVAEHRLLYAQLLNARRTRRASSSVDRPS